MSGMNSFEHQFAESDFWEADRKLEIKIRKNEKPRGVVVHSLIIKDALCEQATKLEQLLHCEREMENELASAFLDSTSPAKGPRSRIDTSRPKNKEKRSPRRYPVLHGGYFPGGDLPKITAR